MICEVTVKHSLTVYLLNYNWTYAIVEEPG